MTYLVAATLAISILSLVVAIRTAMLNYKLRAEDIRYRMGIRMARGLDRAASAKLVLQYLSAVNSNARSAGLLDLPSLIEIEGALRNLKLSHDARPDSEVIGMRSADMESLRAVEEPLAEIEQRLNSLGLMVGYGDARGTA